MGLGGNIKSMADSKFVEKSKSRVRKLIRGFGPSVDVTLARTYF